MKKSLLTTALLVAGLMASSMANAASLLVNGSFETTDLTGWSTSGNISVFANGAPTCCIASEGTYFADFNDSNTTPNGVLSQSFTTVIGQQYQLTFDFTKGGTGAGTAALDVQVNGTGSLLNTSVSDTIGGNPGVYAGYSYFFTADSALTTLSFSDASDATINFDALLDNVSVTETPIPAAAWLFGTGLVGLIGASKRKKAKALEVIAA